MDGDGVPTWQEFGNQGRDTSSAAPPVPPTGTPTPVPIPISILEDGASLDADSDGLIEVSSLEQLNAVRYDLDGDGTPDDSGTAIYALAFPASATDICNVCNGYELTRPLDFQDPDSYSSGVTNPLWATGSGWLPIGIVERENQFNATFEGNGHTISNLYINRTTTLEDAEATGLFGYTGPSAVIRGVGLVDVSVVGLGFVGSLVGENWGMIRDSYGIGHVSGTTHVGGLVGFNWYWDDSNQEWQIESSYVEVNVNGTDYVGGLIGMHYGTVYASYASGKIIGDEVVGGLIGGNGGTLSASYVTGQVSGRESIGGLVGYNFDTIDTSYANVHVMGDEYVGGLVGSNNVDVFASYSMGSVSGNRLVGGLVGNSSGEGRASAIINSYATGEVWGNELVGGLVGANYGAVIDSFWDTQATEQTTGAGKNDPSNDRHYVRAWWDGEVQIIGKTTSELQEPIDYAGIYARWNRSAKDIGLHWDQGTRDLSAVWDFGTNSQYPALKVDFDGDGQASWQEFGSQVRDLTQPTSSTSGPDEADSSTVLLIVIVAVKVVLAIGTGGAYVVVRRR